MNYKELMKETKDARKDVKKGVETLADVCQEFWCYNQMYKQLEKPIKTLKNYLPVGEGLSGRELQGERKRQQSLPIKHKLYIELLYNIYKEFSAKKTKEEIEKEFCKKVIHNKNYEEYIDEMCRKAFPEIADNTMNTLRQQLKHSASCWSLYDNTINIDNLKLDNLHNAMKQLQKILAMPMPEKAESLEKVLNEDTLETLLCYLKDKESMGVGALFLSTQIRRTIRDGAISKYIPRPKDKGKPNPTVFFAQNFDNNLTTLKSSIMKLRDLEEEYTITLEDTQEFLSLIKK